MSIIRSGFVLALVLAAGGGRAIAAVPVVYCTEVGPIELEIENGTARGRYEIQTKNIQGVFEGRIEDGVIAARWTDPDGTGNLRIYLSDNDRRLRALIHSDTRKAWSDYLWEGTEQGAARHVNNPALKCDVTGAGWTERSKG